MKKHFAWIAVFVLSVFCAEATVYRPGLIQAKFDTDVKPFGTLTPEIIASSTSDRIPGVVMANIKTDESGYAAAANSYSNQWSGLVWNWNKQRTTFGYAGQIYLEAGTTYAFGKQLDDGATIHIDGVQWISNGTHTAFVSTNFTAAATGWVPIEVCIWDGTGGKGPTGGTWGNDLGLAYNTLGWTEQAPKESWSPIIDDGSMTFLRTATSESFVRLSGLRALDGAIAVDVMTHAPVAASLTVWLSDVNGGEDPDAWGEVSQTLEIAAGEQTYTLTLPIADLSSEEPWCGVYLEGTDANGVFYEWLAPFQCSTEPVLWQSIDTVEYTNLVLTVGIEQLGLDASYVDASLEFATDPEMTQIFKTVPVATAVASIPGVFADILVGDLDHTTTYYVRAKGVTDTSILGVSEVSTFTTLAPSAPSGAFMLMNIGFNSFAVDYQITDYGLGAQECTKVWVEVATQADFSDVQQTLAGTDVTGGLPVVGGTTVTSLSPSTQYFVRLRLENVWGESFEFVTDAQVLQTASQPYVFSGIGALNTSNGTDVFLSLMSIESGVSLNVELLLDDVSVQTWPNVTSAQKFTGSLGTLIGGHTVKFVVTGTLSAAALTTEIFQQAVSGGQNIYTAGQAGDFGLFLFDTDDQGSLPPLLMPGSYYRVLNASVAQLQDDGVSVRALSPGGTGIELWQNTFTGSYAVARANMTVVPPAIGNGKVFRYFEKPSGNPQWESDANWECLSHPGYAGFPQSPDDIAMVLTTNRKSVTFMIGAKDCNLGGLYVGHFGNVDGTTQLESVRDAGGALTFRRTDGEPAFIKATCGGTNVTTLLNMGAANIESCLGINLRSDLTVDGGFNGEDRGPYWQMANFGWRRLLLDIPEGITFRVVNGQPYDSRTLNSRFYFTIEVVVTGGGTIWNDSAYALNISGDWSGFTGLLREHGYGHSGYDRNANFQFYANTFGGCVLEILGFVSPDLEIPKSAGYVATGINHNYGGPSSNPGNRLPGQILMQGGTLELRSEDAKAWASSAITNSTDRLTVGSGMNRLIVASRNAADHPTNTFYVGELIHPGRGTIRMQEATAENDNQRSYTRIANYAAHAIGGGGAFDSGVNSIIPWMFGPAPTKTSTYAFTSADETGLVRTNAVTKLKLADVTEPLLNVYNGGGDIILKNDVTVNSLVLMNSQYNQGSNKGQCLGTNRTLIISSGGLIFANNGTHLGRYDLPPEIAGNIVFPRTAYVHATGTGGSPNQIAAKITAADDLVFGNAGMVSLMNDQTGIRGSIYINNGTLFLGYIDGSVGTKIDCDLRIVGGGSTVCVTKGGALSSNRNIIFEDTSGFAGKLDLPAGVNEFCKMLFVGDLENSLPRGTYGASGSGAEFIDDAHFSGTGILTVRRDTIIQPMILRIF